MARVVLAYPYEGHEPDDQIELADDVALGLVRDGWARYGVSSPDTVADVLAHVGDDADLAAAALASEKAAGKPRKALVSQLEAIVTPISE